MENRRIPSVPRDYLLRTNFHKVLCASEKMSRNLLNDHHNNSSQKMEPRAKRKDALHSLSLVKKPNRRNGSKLSNTRLS